MGGRSQLDDTYSSHREDSNNDGGEVNARRRNQDAVARSESELPPNYVIISYVSQSKLNARRCSRVSG